MKKKIEFIHEFPGDKAIIFSSKIAGIKIRRREYKAKDDGVLIYDQVAEKKADEVMCQLSSNTSTLIPALKVLGLPYNTYFDQRDVVESQNDITFYWQPSYLASFYNRYSTDGIEPEKREFLIRSAIQFLTSSKNTSIEKLLKKEFLSDMKEDVKFLGLFEGVPIFDAGHGMPMLKARIGIHVGIESVMVSTPMDKYADDVKEVAGKLSEKSGATPTYKKNRIRFEKTEKILSALNVK